MDKLNIWCYWQDEDKEGIYCTAHLCEGRVFNCPYKDLKDRDKAEYPCSDYKELENA